MAASPASTGCSTVVATFRAVGDRPPYHHVVRATGRADMGADVETEALDALLNESPVRVWEGRQAVSSAPPPHRGSDPAAPSAGAPATVAGYHLVGQLGGHEYTTSPLMCRTSIIPPLGRSGGAPHFACADAATRQIWVWDLEDGESHIDPTAACTLPVHCPTSACAGLD